MRIHIATDHAGLDFSTHLITHLSAAGHEVIDHGPTSYDAARRLPGLLHQRGPGRRRTTRPHGIEALGVVFGGSGNGEQIAANKVTGIRAALVWNLSTAQLAREHNDANVISIGARQHTIEDATSFIDAFIAEPFSGEERHARRIAQLAEYETDRRHRGQERRPVLEPN